VSTISPPGRSTACPTSREANAGCPFLRVGRSRICSPWLTRHPALVRRNEAIAGGPPFAEQFLIRAEMVAAFGDETTALIMYDTETIPAKSAPAAEYVTVRDGKIVHNRFIFDRLPFEEFRRRGQVVTFSQPPSR
jgi:hypothetical protein